MDYLKEVERRLDLPPAEKQQVMSELESHHIELMDELLSTGMSESEAKQEAARRMGDPQEIAMHMQSVHCRATHKTALLAALPFFAAVLLGAVLHLLRGFGDNSGYQYSIFHGIAAYAVLGLLLIAGSIRELLADRRPVWLATWVPAGMVLTGISTTHLLFIAEAEAILRPLSVFPAGYEALHDLMGPARTDLRVTIAGLLGIISKTALGILVYRHSVRSVLAVTLLGTAGAFIAIHHQLSGSTHSAPGAYIATVTGIVLLYAIALGLPKFSKSELLVQPTLFMFTFFSLYMTLTLVATFVFYTEIPNGAYTPVWFSVGGALAGAVVYLATRSSTWLFKLGWISLGVLGVNVSYIAAASRPMLAYSTMIVMLWYLVFIILIPAALSRSKLAIHNRYARWQ